jgi:hypothetical protein
MVPASGNSLSPPAISRGPAFSLTLLCGQIPGEGDNMRIRLRPVMPNPAKTVKLYELLATLQFKVFDFVDQLAISSITGTPDIG